MNNRIFLTKLISMYELDTNKNVGIIINGWPDSAVLSYFKGLKYHFIIIIFLPCSLTSQAFRVTFPLSSARQHHTSPLTKI